MNRAQTARADGGGKKTQRKLSKSRKVKFQIGSDEGRRRAHDVTMSSHQPVLDPALTTASVANGANPTGAKLSRRAKAFGGAGGGGRRAPLAEKNPNRVGGVVASCSALGHPAKRNSVSGRAKRFISRQCSLI